MISENSRNAIVVLSVLALGSFWIARKGPVAVVLERDNDVPALDVLIEERAMLQRAYDRGLEKFSADKKVTA